MLNLEQSFLWIWKSDTSESWLEMSGKFWNLVPEKNGVDYFDRSCEKWSITNIHGGKEYSGTSVHELNPFLEAVREPKCS
jgi:hypothetical protein